eukprot:159146_1
MAIIFQWMAIVFICLVRVDQSVQTCDAGKQQIWHDSFHSRSQINNNWETYYSGNQLDLLPLTYDQLEYLNDYYCWVGNCLRLGSDVAQHPVIATLKQPIKTMGYSDITIKYTVSGYASGGPSSSPPYTTNGKCEFQVFNGLFTQVVSETTSTSASTYVMADNKIDFQAKVKTINDQQNTASNSDSIYVVLKASTT